MSDTPSIAFASGDDDADVSNPRSPLQVIRTSEVGWLARLAALYKAHSQVALIDEAQVGVDPVHQSLFDMGRQAKLTTREFSGVCVALGISAAGIGMILLAFVDPEPTSKLSLLVAGGIVCLLFGGPVAVQILTKRKPPKVVVGKGRFEISWD